MRRFLPVLILASLLLGACSPVVTLLTRVPRVTPTPTVAPVKAPATATAVPTSTRPPDLGVNADALQGVEVLIWHGLDGSSAGLFAKMAADFSASNQWGIKVKVAAWPNLNTLSTEVDGSLNSPNQPDIIVALPEQILAWQQNVIDLSPYFAQPEIGMNAQDITAAIGAQSNVDGVRYGVPMARSARFLFYDTSFARDLGFDAAPQTADDFYKQACAANGFWKQDTDLTNDGFGGLALDVVSNWQAPYSWLGASGGKVFASGSFLFNTPDNIKAMEFFTTLREDGCAWQPSSMSNFEHLASRKALFITGSLGDISSQNLALSAAASPDQWTVLPFPGETPGIVAYGPDYAVLKSSGERQLAAWLFIRWMLEDQNQVLWAHGTGLLPVTISAANELQEDASTIPQVKAALKLLPQVLVYPQSAEWRKVDKVFADGFMAYDQGYPGVTLEDVFTIMDTTVADLSKK